MWFVENTKEIKVNEKSLSSVSQILITMIVTWRDRTLFVACALELCWYTSGTTAFGTGSSGSNSDRLNNPYHLAIDSSGAFYVADLYNHRIQKFTTSSVAITVAGQGNGNSGSGPTYLNQPTYVLVDSNGNLYVSDSQNHRIQYFTGGSLVGVTIAGTGKSRAHLFFISTEGIIVEF